MAAILFRGGWYNMAMLKGHGSTHLLTLIFKGYFIIARGDCLCYMDKINQYYTTTKTCTMHTM